MAGETVAAAATLDRAAVTATNEAERRHLAARAARLRSPRVTRGG
jgi:hypothetical protein